MIDAEPHALGGDEGFVEAGVGHEGHELISAYAPEVVSLPHGLGHALAEGLEDLVADGVTVVVVHLLEIVAVDEHSGERRIFSKRSLRLRAQHLLEPSVIQEAGQGVDAGDLLEALVGDPQLAVHRAQDGPRVIERAELGAKGVERVSKLVKLALLLGARHAVREVMPREGLHLSEDSAQQLAMR